MIKNICVFCGSSSGEGSLYKQQAVKLVILLAKNNIRLVYGGGNIGLMGVIADTMLVAGGEVIGVIPEHIKKIEVAHNSLTEMHVVKSMDERKTLMTKLSDAFIAMPGGYGTLDELFEVLSLNQLSIISKPCGILNVDGYFNHLLKYLDHGVEEKFIRQAHREMLIVEENEEVLLEKLREYKPVKLGKWWNE
jgi:uncharacterized protein (TIGR00730 family)